MRNTRAAFAATDRLVGVMLTAVCVAAGCTLENVSEETPSIDILEADADEQDGALRRTELPPVRQLDATTETSSDTPKRSGVFGSPCLNHDQCDAGLCMDTPFGKTCSMTCSGTCPSNQYACLLRSVGGGDPSSYCLPRWLYLCNPCTKHSECNSGAGPNVCVQFGPEGSFCGTTCTNSGDCPTDYICKEWTEPQTQKTFKMCQPFSGVCSCSNFAVTQSAATVCTLPGANTCVGSRLCTHQGLTACDITGQPEKCNGKDDDCDGLTDEALCDDGNPCTTGSCNTDGSCKQTHLDNVPCDDGSVCTQTDVCNFASCVGGNALACDDGNVCTKNACDKKSGCAFPPASGVCDDGNQCTINDVCSEGVCNGGGPKTCNDNNPCTLDKCDPLKPKGCYSVATSDGPNPLCPKDANPKTVDGCFGGKCASK